MVATFFKTVAVVNQIFFDVLIFQDFTFLKKAKSSFFKKVFHYASVKLRLLLPNYYSCFLACIRHLLDTTTHHYDHDHHGVCSHFNNASYFITLGSLYQKEKVKLLLFFLYLCLSTKKIHHCYLNANNKENNGDKSYFLVFFEGFLEEK